MPTTFTSSAGTITPVLVLGYETSSQSRNVLHEVIGAQSPSVTFGGETLRSGTLNLFFDTHATAWGARNFFTSNVVWTLTSTDQAGMAMTFVRQGDLSMELNTETTKESVWTLSVSYQEVN